MEKNAVFKIGFVLGLNALGCGISGFAADDGSGSGNGTPAVNCATLTDQKPDDEKALGTWQQNLQLCAMIDQARLKIQLDTVKSEQLARALSSFSGIQGLNGTITAPTAADHIGELLAQHSLGRASQRMAQQISEKIDTSVTLVTDASMFNLRPQLKSTLAHLASYSTGFSRFNALAEELLLTGKIPPGTQGGKSGSGAEMGLAETLTLLPPAINAAQQLASAFKTNSTLSQLNVAFKPETVWSTLANCSGKLRGKLAIPVLRNSSSNEMTDAYKDARLGYIQARANSERIKALIDKLQSNPKNAATLTKANSLKASLDMWSNQFEALDTALKSTTDGTSKTLFDSLSGTADTMIGAGQKLLFVTVAHFGASGGTISSKWRSDRLAYRATVQLNYLLADERGIAMDGGSVVESNSISVAVDADLPSVINALPPLQCPIKDS